MHSQDATQQVDIAGDENISKDEPKISSKIHTRMQRQKVVDGQVQDDFNRNYIIAKGQVSAINS